MNSTRPATDLPILEESSSISYTAEYSVRIPRGRKRFNVMKFNQSQRVDFKEWKGSKMERENNMKDFKGFDEDMPKFGAGSEFGRDAREEARRKKYGITSKKYKADNQPWILKPTGRTGKKFKGNREGGINENSSYYVFVTNNKGGMDAYPLNEWYNFQPIQRYKALSAEEAEEVFNQRDKIHNHFEVMVRKRLRNDQEDAEESEQLEGEKGKKLGKNKKELKISEMDEWMDSDDDDDDSDSDEKEDKKKSDDEDEDDKKKKKKKDAAKKKKKKVSDDEAFEESDDGDEEGRECDYISDSSASEDELELQKGIKSVAEEDALRKLLASDEEDEDEEEKEKKDDAEKSDEADGDKDDKSNGKKGKNTKKGKKKDTSDSSTDVDSGSASAQSSRSATPTFIAGPSGESRKRPLDSSPGPSTVKKMKTEINYIRSSLSGSSDGAITEEAIRRYLMRKPMTTTELAQKFKPKKTGLNSAQICDLIGKILKNINPIRQKIRDKMYLSLKPEK